MDVLALNDRLPVYVLVVLLRMVTPVPRKAIWPVRRGDVLMASSSSHSSCRAPVMTVVPEPSYVKIRPGAGGMFNSQLMQLGNCMPLIVRVSPAGNMLIQPPVFVW